MKVAEPTLPVLASWLREQGSRLDPGPFVSGAMEARKLVEALPTRMELQSLTHGFEGGIYKGPMLRRVYVTSAEHGVPFLGSTAVMFADFSGVGLLRRQYSCGSRRAPPSSLGPEPLVGWSTCDAIWSAWPARST